MELHFDAFVKEPDDKTKLTPSDPWGVLLVLIF